MNIFTKIFGGGAKEVIGAVGGVLDNLITNKEELAKAKLEAEKEINRHFEVIQSNAIKELELEVQDRTTARQREQEFVKATGHMDYLMWVLAFAGLGLLFFLVWHLVKSTLPAENKELIAHGVGIVEGVVISIYSYYFGSSAGSRIKDMRK